MAIPIKEEDEDTKEIWGSCVEKCHFCKDSTRFWHENTNNPVCPKCSKIHKVSELPDFGKEIRKRKYLTNQTDR